MTKHFTRAGAFDLDEVRPVEHHFSLSVVLIALSFVAVTATTILMLLAQA
jgi:hypothetical protein